MTREAAEREAQRRAEELNKSHAILSRNNTDWMVTSSTECPRTGYTYQWFHPTRYPEPGKTWTRK